VLLLPTGELVVADRFQNRLFLLEGPDRNPLRLPSPGTAPVEWTALASAPGLSFYILDGPGRRVHQYDFRGNYLGQAVDLDAVTDAEDLGPLEPGGLAVDRSGRAMVTDRLGDRLLVFGPGWNLVDIRGETGSEPGTWRRPGAIAVGARAPFLVSDEGNRRLVLLDELGDVLAVRRLEEAARGVAVLAPGRYAASVGDRVLILDAALAPVASLRFPAGSSCVPYATGALAGDAGSVFAGEGCSGRVIRFRDAGN